ncbi:OsmC family peroxiredoxin [Cytophagaceae bacterium ABcell3]|nr:OsmC family peroxiredoxin [Cytophagaceae bacterium ABcell3]
MKEKKGSAFWSGSLREGKGHISVESGTFEKVPYSFSQRFEDSKGANPEELIGAAHASCFSMSLAHELSIAGFVVKAIHTEDKVHLEKGGDGFQITLIEIFCDAEILNIDDETFQDFAENASKNCPVAKALQGVKFKINARLRHAEEV